jgi:D-alanine-D-alanine ligase
MAVEEFPRSTHGRGDGTVQDLAKRAFDALKLRGYARIDFRMATDGTVLLSRGQHAAGMTQTSLIPQAAAAAGIHFPSCATGSFNSRSRNAARGGK